MKRELWFTGYNRNFTMNLVKMEITTKEDPWMMLFYNYDLWEKIERDLRVEGIKIVEPINRHYTRKYKVKNGKGTLVNYYEKGRTEVKWYVMKQRI